MGRCLDTLPERLALANTSGMGHAEFLELVLADEVTRRENTSAVAEPRPLAFDPGMTLDRWDDTANITYDRAVWNELCSLRSSKPATTRHSGTGRSRPDAPGPLASATPPSDDGFTVHFELCDRLLKRLRVSRLDNNNETEIRRLLRVGLLIIDDFALQSMDPVDTADIYELIVERHRTATTVVTSNREPEWFGLMADPLLAQSAIDRLESAAHELILDGESYRSSG